MNKIRLNKAMSILGICSRREADTLIKKGKVKINGVAQKELGTRIKEIDIISFNNREYSLNKNNKLTKIWLYYKKRGFITSCKDELGRPTIFEDIGDRIRERFIYIGRLDLNSEGLLLLTNNGNLSRYAESPKTGWERVYKVKIFGELNSEIVKEIENGITIDEIKYAPMKITFTNTNSKNMWCTCILTEGKNREIRKIFKKFGLMVNKLIRYKYGPFTLKNMQPGEIKEVPPNIIKTFLPKNLQL